MLITGQELNRRTLTHNQYGHTLVSPRRKCFIQNTVYTVGLKGWILWNHGEHLNLDFLLLCKCLHYLIICFCVFGNIYWCSFMCLQFFNAWPVPLLFSVFLGWFISVDYGCLYLFISLNIFLFPLLCSSINACVRLFISNSFYIILFTCPISYWPGKRKKGGTVVS